MSAKHCLASLIWQASDDDISAGKYEPSDELIREMDKQWFQFKTRCELICLDPEVAFVGPLPSDNDGDYWNQVAHDFIMTRNGHGCGFWDGDWAEPWATILTDLSHEFGEIAVYVGDDNLLYC